MLETRALTFSYSSKQSFSFPDLHVKQGESLLVLGESGKGKTTFLNLLAGFIRPSGGKIEIDDYDITQMPDATLDQFRGKFIGMVFQTAHFVKALNVEENLKMAQLFARSDQKGSGIIQDTLSRLNLESKLKDYPHRLSIGEQQRVAIARAVINQPKLILADEPTSALDDYNCQGVLDLLREQAEIAGASLIIVTHDNRLKDKIENRVEL
ncbi:MAG: ATP-binding cassette domain-containing protein [Bacteroidota bacterium]